MAVTVWFASNLVKGPLLDMVENIPEWRKEYGPAGSGRSVYDPYGFLVSTQDLTNYIANRKIPPMTVPGTPAC